MKTKIKTSLLTLSFICATTFNALADNDVTINFNELPIPAQKTINANFAKSKVAISKKDVELFDKSYDVIFTNGDKIEFDADGVWEKISCKSSSVPKALIPATILQYVANHFPEHPIIEIEREKRGFEVELQNGMELKFDKKGKCIDIDN